MKKPKERPPVNTDALLALIQGSKGANCNRAPHNKAASRANGRPLDQESRSHLENNPRLSPIVDIVSRRRNAKLILRKEKHTYIEYFNFGRTQKPQTVKAYEQNAIIVDISATVKGVPGVLVLVVRPEGKGFTVNRLSQEPYLGLLKDIFLEICRARLGPRSTCNTTVEEPRGRKQGDPVRASSPQAGHNLGGPTG